MKNDFHYSKYYVKMQNCYLCHLHMAEYGRVQFVIYFEYGCELCTFFDRINCQQHKAWETSVKLLFARLDLESISTLNSEPNIETKYVS